jgi:predicted DCC family thiol-disulfide oxidoreductase YuxK
VNARVSWHLLYDADCGFCRWTVGWALRLDRRRRLEPGAIQDSPELLRAVPERERLQTAHVVSPDGAVHSGGAALAQLLDLLLPGGRAIATVPAVPRVLYSTVAGRRALLGRLVTEAAKARADALIERRQAGS